MHSDTPSDTPSNETEPACAHDAFEGELPEGELPHGQLPEGELPVEASVVELDGPASPLSEPELPDVPPFPTPRGRGDSLLLQTGQRIEDDSVPEPDVPVSASDSEGFHSEGYPPDGWLSSLRQPQEIREFNRIVPGAAERLLQLAEGEARHRQEMERLQVEEQIALERARLDHETEANLEVVRARVARIRGANTLRLVTGCGVQAVAILSFCLAGYLSLKGQVEVAKAVVYAVAVVYLGALLAGGFRQEARPRKHLLPEWPPDTDDEGAEEAQSLKVH